jgi:ATP-dependent Lhr-like helicase
VRLAAVDPLNLTGLITPGPRVPATRGNTVTYRDGLPIVEHSGTVTAVRVRA